MSASKIVLLHWSRSYHHGDHRHRGVADLFQVLLLGTVIDGSFAPLVPQRLPHRDFCQFSRGDDQDQLTYRYLHNSLVFRSQAQRPCAAAILFERNKDEIVKPLGEAGASPTSQIA